MIIQTFKADQRGKSKKHTLQHKFEYFHSISRNEMWMEIL